jgi:UDP-GlcNAc:undecaprenyl-phosphate GlcNAc-1-phosphate transferase
MTDILPISFFVGALLILFEKIRNKFGFINLRDSVQTLHKKSISRYGGAAIFISLWLISYISDVQEYEFLRAMLLCVAPIFLLGILDDFSVKIPPVVRLLIVFPTAFLSYFFLGTEAYSLNIPIIDDLFEYQIFSVLFICFALAGIVNAFNMIDGINGLVLLFSISVCISTISFGHAAVSNEMLLYFVALFFSMIGIFILNFPLGRIFIGDGGAYFLGGAIAIGVIKIYQENSFSPWYVMLMFIYPVTDVIFSFVRRILLKKSTIEPDDMHLHHVLLKRIKKTGLESDKLQHFFVTVLTFIFYTPFLVGANYFADNTIVLACLSLIFILFYLSLYIILMPKSFRKS